MGGPALVLLGFVLAVLALRRLPVVMALGRWLGLGRFGTAYLGWFGPMGVASAFYLAMAHAERATTPRVWAAGTAMIAASTLVHGATAAPARAMYERRFGARGDPAAADHAEPAE